MLLHGFQPKKFDRARWKSATVGDIFLPIGIASSCAIAAELHGVGAWYAKTWWGLTVLLLGLTVNLFMEIVILHYMLKRYTFTQQLAPSNVWHSIAFIPLFYLSVVSAIPAIIIHEPLHLVVGVIIGYGGWIASFVYDFWRPPVTTNDIARL